MKILLNGEFVEVNRNYLVDVFPKPENLDQTTYEEYIITLETIITILSLDQEKLLEVE